MYRKLEPKLVAIFREGYTLKQFQGDLLGGLTVGVVAIPLAIALAIVSEVQAVLARAPASSLRARLGPIHREQMPRITRDSETVSIVA